MTREPSLETVRKEIDASRHAELLNNLKNELR